MARMADKVVLITGGAGGLGGATARRMAEEGAPVVIADLSDEQGQALADEVGGEYVRLNVTDEEQWHATIEGVRSKHGRIDVLVNGAGIEGDMVNGSPESTTLEEWHRVFAVNLDGTFLGCQHVLPVMKEARKGVILNISSVAAYFGTPSNSAYGASKAAVQQFSKTVAIYGARDGMRIRCNSVHPGAIRTNMSDSIYEMLATAANISKEEAKQLTLRDVPFGEVGEPDDVAYLLLYLASDEAKYVTGSEFVVDAGWQLVGAG